MSSYPRAGSANDLPGSSNRKKSLAAVGPPDSLGGNAQRGPRTATRRARVAKCSPSPIGQRAGSTSPNFDSSKATHRDAEGIEHDGENEDGEQQRSAAKGAAKTHRVNTVSGLTEARTPESLYWVATLSVASLPHFGH